MASDRRTDLSVVIPVFNERDNVEPLYRSLRGVLASLPEVHEILFVDDGSTDGTFDVLARLKAEDPTLRIVRLRRNFGQTPALAAGFDHARGRLVVTMDGDLQNDPADLPKLLAELDRGHDLVVGWRRDRRDHYWTRVFPSRVANWLIGRVTGVRVHDHGCTLKAVRASTLRRLKIYSDMHRFIPAFAGAMGASVTELPVNHRPRIHGRSKYGISRTVKVLFDLITVRMISRFSTRPVHWFGILSVPFFVLGLGFLFFSFVNHNQLLRFFVVHVEPTGNLVFPSISMMFLFLSVHFLVLGFVSELVLRVGDLRMEEVMDPGSVQVL